MKKKMWRTKYKKQSKKYHNWDQISKKKIIKWIQKNKNR